MSTTLRPRTAALLASVVALGALTGCANLVRVSEGPGHLEADGASGAPSVNLDGRWIAFSSRAANLAGPDGNGTFDVLLRDRQTGAVELVSRTAGGSSGNAASDQPSVSESGSRIAFRSAATDLATGPGATGTDILVRDRTAGTTTRVCRATDGTPANAACDSPRISGDGKLVAFVTAADNLVADDTNHRADVFVRDLATGTTTMVSVRPDGTPSGGTSTAPAINRDGRFVAFKSTSGNLVPGDSNGGSDVFLRDRLAGSTTRVSVTSAGVQVSAGSGNPAISADGTVIAFDSPASDIIANDENGATDVFVRNLNTLVTAMISVDASNDEGEGASQSPSISADGRFVAFMTPAELVADDHNQRTDVYVRDRLKAKTRRVSTTDRLAEVDGSSVLPAMSGDGRSVAFQSSAEDLVTADANHVDDVFVRAVTVPSISSVSPGFVPRGGSTTVTVNGSGFLPDAMVLVPVEGVSVDSVTVVSDTKLTVGISASAGATPGAASVWVLLPGPVAGFGSASLDRCDCFVVT